MIALPLPSDPPPRFARHTPDGFVILSPEALEIFARGKLSHAVAKDMWIELMRASMAAERADQHLRGFDEWITVPLSGGEYEVTHGGETCRFRPIVNGKRGQRPGRRARAGHLCTACRREAPEGATMYVPATDDPRRTRGLWGGRRLCSPCVRPELAAAVLGAAVVAAGSRP